LWPKFLARRTGRRVVEAMLRSHPLTFLGMAAPDPWRDFSPHQEDGRDPMPRLRLLVKPRLRRFAPNIHQPRR